MFVLQRPRLRNSSIPRWDDGAFGSTIIAASTSSYAAANARADVVYARSFLTQTHLKGTIGECFAERYFLNNQLEQSIRGSWVPLTPRTGPQGLDHLFVKLGRNGQLYWMVGESKFGSSQLGTTNGGVRQLSTQWTTERLHKIGERYLEMTTRPVEFKHLPPGGGNIQLDVPLDNGKKVAFWKEADGKWFFSGTHEELKSARAMVRKMGESLTSARCNVRVRLFHVEASGINLKITLYRVNPGEVTTISKLNAFSEFTIEGALRGNITDKEFQRLIVVALRGKFPDLTQSELEDTAGDILKKYKAGEFLTTPKPFAQTVVTQALSAATVAAALEMFSQFWVTSRVDVKRVTLTALSTGIGVASGQLIGAGLISYRVGVESVRFVSKLLNLSTGMTRGVLSSGGSGIVTTLVMAYGALAFGSCDWKQANRMVVSGLGATAVSSAVGAGVPSVVASTLFPTLHGAAAANATMAWLGFGSLASGGYGVMGGAFVLGSGAVVAGMVVSMLLSYGFKLHDENENRKYLLLLAEKYDELNVWMKIAKRMKKM